LRKFSALFSIFTVSTIFLCSAAVAANDDRQACLVADHHRNPSDDYETCNRALRRIDLSKPDRAKLLASRGESAYFANRMDLAITDLDEAITLDPDYGHAYLRRGWIRIHIGQRAGALQDFSTLLAMEPENTAALFAIAHYYSRTTEWKIKSLSVYKHLLDVNPNDHLTRYNYAELLCCTMARPDQAIVEYDRILKASDDELAKVPLWKPAGNNMFDFRGLVRIARIEALIGLGNTDLAFQAIGGMIADYPKNGGVFSTRAYLYSAQRKYSESLADAKKAVELDPFSGDKKRQVIEALYHLKRYDEGMESINAFLVTSLSNASRGDLLFWRGVFFKQLQRPDEALADFENSFVLNPQGLQSMMIQVVQYGYYDGAESDPYSDKARNALQACIIDPKCAS
jgi:tetratricopeptide (TPR) repeat protein